MAGRPLRFIGIAMAGWIGFRVAALWPASDAVAVPPVAVAAKQAPRAVPPVARVDHPPTAEARPVARARVTSEKASVRADRPNPPGASPTATLDRPEFAIADALSPTTAVVRSLRAEPQAPGLPRPIPPFDERQAVSRFTASFWTIARGSGSGGGLNASQLGGSQAGARIAYAVDDDRRLAVVGRIATPLRGRGREAALGAELRLADGAVRLFAEQRFALDGGRGGPSAGVIGGLDRRLPAGFRLEAYGQAGAIRRDRTEAFADGAMRVATPVVSLGPARVDLGLGAWGGAQRGAARLDVGPTLGLAVPVGDRTLRLSLDWRERVAGGARPGSGPALSVGTDF